MLDIPEGVKVELDAKGLEGRWINYNQYLADGNFHKEGWVPYKPEKQDASNGFFFGNNPDGIIRRKELVLAARDKEVCEAHRTHLRDKANLTKGFKKAQKAELRQMAVDGRFSTQIEAEDEDTE
jgi:hypothetical protein